MTQNELEAEVARLRKTILTLAIWLAQSAVGVLSGDDVARLHEMMQPPSPANRLE